MEFDGVAESQGEYTLGIDQDHEQEQESKHEQEHRRCATEREHDEEAKQRDANEGLDRLFLSCTKVSSPLC